MKNTWIKIDPDTIRIYLGHRLPYTMGIRFLGGCKRLKSQSIKWRLYLQLKKPKQTRQAK